MVRRFAPLCLILVCSCLGFASASQAQFSSAYRQAAQDYRNAAAQCSGPQQACYQTWASYYDCVASTFQSGSRVTCTQPAQDCSKLGGSGSAGPAGAPGAAAPANTNSDPVMNLLSSLPPPKTTGQLMGRMGLGMGLEALNIWAKHHNSSASGDSSGSGDGPSDAGGAAGPPLQQQLNDQEDQALQAMNAADQQQSAQQFQRSLQNALEPDAQATAEDALSANAGQAPDDVPQDPSQALLNDTASTPDSSADAIPDVEQVPAIEQAVAQQAGPEWTQALNSIQGQQQTSPSSTNQLLTSSWQDLDHENVPGATSTEASPSSWHNPLEDAVPEGLMLTAQKAAADLVSGVETTIGDALSNLPMHMAIAKGADMLLDAKDSAVCDGESDQIVHGNCMIDQAGSEVGQGIATRIFAIHRQFYENILNPMVQRFFPNPD